MKHPRRGLVITLVAGLTIVSGLTHGRMTDRWGKPTDMLAAAAKLEKILPQFGKWQLQSTHEIDPLSVKILECAGYIHRQYVNRKTGQAVSVSVICGPPGPTSVHTPEICYDSQGHTIKQAPQHVTIVDSEGTEHTFWTIMLEANDVDRGRIQVYYAWSAGNVWVAPKNPRISLSKHSYLFKIQLAAPVVAGTDLSVSDSCRDFLRDFLPVAKRYVTKSPRGSTEVAPFVGQVLSD